MKVVSPGRASLAIALQVAGAYVGATGIVGFAGMRAIEGMAPDRGATHLAGVSRAVAWIGTGSSVVGLLSLVALIRWTSAARQDAAALSGSKTVARGSTWPAFVVPVYSLLRLLPMLRELRRTVDPRGHSGPGDAEAGPAPGRHGAVPPVELWFATTTLTSVVAASRVYADLGAAPMLVGTALFAASSLLAARMIARLDAWIRATYGRVAGARAAQLDAPRPPVLTATLAGLLGITGAAALVAGAAAPPHGRLPFLVLTAGLPAGAVAVMALRRVPARMRELSVGALCAIAAAGAGLFAFRVMSARRAHSEALWEAYARLSVAPDGPETWDATDELVTHGLGDLQRRAEGAPHPDGALCRCGGALLARSVRASVANARARAGMHDILHLPWVLTADQIRQRISRVDAFAAVTDERRDLAQHGMQESIQCLKDAEVPEAAIQGYIAGAAWPDPGPLLEVLATEREYAVGTRSILQVLLDEDGRWSLGHGVHFDRTDASRRWDAANLRFLEAERRNASALRRHGGLPTRDTERVSVPEARRGFVTSLVKTKAPRGPMPAPPTPEHFRSVRYRSPVGEMTAFVTPDPKDGLRHPAIVWAHVGLGGATTERTPGTVAHQMVEALREAGIVVVIPTFRGEPGNPGTPELYGGEVEDLLAARAHAAALPWVDPGFVYLGGCSSGATLALLAAASTDDFRAAFGLLPLVDLAMEPDALADAPFDTSIPRELELRSSIRFAPHIHRPTFLFDTGGSRRAAADVEMAELSAGGAGPVQALLVPTFDAVAIVLPLTRLIAKTIARDAAGHGLKLGKAEVDDATANVRVTTDL